MTQELEPKNRSIRQGLALFVSNFGNPFSLLFLLTLYSCLKFLPIDHAIRIIAGIFFLAILPTGLFIVFNVKRGAYTNYDVSNQSQRRSLYYFSLVIIVLILAGLIYFKEPPFIIGGSLAAFTLLLLSYLVNLKLKCSLHTSFSIFIAISFLQLNIYWSMGLFVFSLIMAWSRLELHRHTFQEVIAGAILGITVGIAFHYIMQPYLAL